MSNPFDTPWFVAWQAPLSLEFSRQEYWSGLSFPSLGDLLDLGIEPVSPALQKDSLLLSHQEKPPDSLTEWERRLVNTWCHRATLEPGFILHEKKQISYWCTLIILVFYFMQLNSILTQTFYGHVLLAKGQNHCLRNHLYPSSVEGGSSRDN